MASKPKFKIQACCGDDCDLCLLTKSSRPFSTACVRIPGIRLSIYLYFSAMPGAIDLAPRMAAVRVALILRTSFPKMRTQEHGCALFDLIASPILANRLARQERVLVARAFHDLIADALAHSRSPMSGPRLTGCRITV